MAALVSSSLLCILTICISLPCIILESRADVDADIFFVELNQNPVGEKLTRLRFYWHDILSGRSPTSVKVVRSAANMPFVFGQVNMFDNPLTIGIELSSRMIGRAQGFYAQASQEEIGLLMYMNFVFTYGKYNGSTITILGRNAVFDPLREMAVVGGTGLFRYARGYAEVRTRRLDLKSGDATVEYNVRVMHY